MTAIRKYWIALIFSGFAAFAYAQNDHGHDHPTHTDQHGHEHAQPDSAAPQPAEHAEEHGKCGHSINAPQEFNAGDNAVHHISDANIIHVFGDIYFHLPVILKSEKGWSFMTTKAFHPHHHSTGENSHEGYVLVHGGVMRIQGGQMADRDYAIEDITHLEVEGEGKKKMQYNAVIEGQCYPLEAKTTYDGGILGGGVTSFMDFSITRNVFTMLMTAIFLFLVFRSVANSATKRRGHAPKGLQNFIEPFYTFIRDEVAKPNIGHHYEKYMPYLMSAFFFILGLNLIGQIPFFPGSANVTGNISITIVLAVLTFLISTFSANKHFWEHTLWMPGVPALLKIFILTPIEILGLFLKPFTLLLRLFANITAGHIVILSFVSLIFILGKSGESMSGSIIGIGASTLLTLFMMTLELLVAFLQAFIFTMLSATYIGTAIEEPHHH
ncbi:MAG: F0F1 ATP synthase subunit A [Saprospiraceae bacterium]|nr:F0F1 ATP synthase subunit A [Saprospiraceae bacterium]